MEQKLNLDMANLFRPQSVPEGLGIITIYIRTPPSHAFSRSVSGPKKFYGLLFIYYLYK